MTCRRMRALFQAARQIGPVPLLREQEVLMKNFQKALDRCWENVYTKLAKANTKGAKPIRCLTHR